MKKIDIKPIKEVLPYLLHSKRITGLLREYERLLGTIHDLDYENEKLTDALSSMRNELAHAYAKQGDLCEQIVELIADRKHLTDISCASCVVPHNAYTGCPKLDGLVTPPDFFCSFYEGRG